MKELKAYLKLELESEKIAKTIYHALLPEITSPPSEERGIATIKLGNNIVEVLITAKDLSALRALVNTYLYWIAGILKSINTTYRVREKK